MQTASQNELAAEPQSGDRTWLHGAVLAATKHWPEYLIEAACLGLFMVSACSFTVLLEHPASAIRQRLSSALVRRLLGGIAMGVTAVALIYSPWGKQSGAHLNPSVTLTFLRLGKVEPWDAGFYVVAQFIGGDPRRTSQRLDLGPCDRRTECSLCGYDAGRTRYRSRIRC